MDNMKKRLILASASPRRRELLTLAGFAFEVIPAVGKEVVHEENGKPLTPDRIVRQLALHKAEEIFDREKGATGLTVIGADTIVVLDGEILGKPKDEDDAKAMLSRLSGRRHEVISGLALIGYGKSGTAHEVTEVEFDDMDEETILRYIRTAKPYDKAGAYAIQGLASAYIKGIEGDYFNVVGLPVHRMCCLYREIFKENLL